MPLFGLGSSSKGHMGPIYSSQPHRVSLFHWTEDLRCSYEVALKTSLSENHNYLYAMIGLKYDMHEKWSLQ
jgi:hypothetical protein